MALIRGLFFSVLVLSSTFAWADSGPSRREKTAMIATLSELSPTTSAREIETLIEREFGRSFNLRAKRTDEMLAHLAERVANVTSKIVRSARDNDVEEARSSLRDLVLLLAYVTQVRATPTIEQLGSSARRLIAYVAVTHAATAMVLNEVAMKYGLGLGSAIEVTSVAAAIFYSWSFVTIRNNPALAQGSGPRRLADRYAKNESLDSFWAEVSRRLSVESVTGPVEVGSLGEFKRLIGEDLRGISIEGACASALLLEPVAPPDKH